MNLIAHITEKNGERIEQPLAEHCAHTAEYAAESIGSAGFRRIVFCGEGDI